MNVLINCSNLKTGGALQVADSICHELYKYEQHDFTIVASDALINSLDDLQKTPNLKILNYNFKNNFHALLYGRDTYLDSIEKKNNISAVLTLFGPISWIPKSVHICGFARGQLLLSDSPFYTRMKPLERFFKKIHNFILSYYFQRGVNVFFTENEFITEKWKHLVKNAKVFTITNFYNQVFDRKNEWQNIKLPKFDGKTFLCITSYYKHKNLEIAIDVAKSLLKINSSFKFRFVFTISEDEYPIVPESLKRNFLFLGKVSISECPSLYTQANVMFQPTLMECFTATYPEAMKMEVPIVTTDLEFAHGLCGNAALYYKALDAHDAARILYNLCNDKKLCLDLIVKGKQQLLKYDSYEQRASKLIKIIEEQKYGRNETF